MSSRPLVVAVTDLVHRLGTRRAVRREVLLEDLAITTAAVAPGVDTVVDLQLESISNGIVAYGTITVPWIGACRRCLEDVRSETTVDVREIFERKPVDGETYPLNDDLVNLEPMVRDAALLALPLAPLCAADCLGPAPESFPAAVAGATVGARPGDAAAGTTPSAAVPAGAGTAPDRDDDDDEPLRDPRWSALDQLKFD